MKIHSISIKNYKSIRQLDDFELRDINILIGSNGAGKSNFISFFKFLNQIVNKNLQNYTAKKGGADTFLYFGKKVSSYLTLEIVFEWDSGRKEGYSIQLETTDNETFIIKKEVIHYGILNKKSETEQTLKGIYESDVNNKSMGIAINDLKFYHFHDTSDTAEVKGFSDIEDNYSLRENASNLAAFLYFLHLKYPQHYNRIEKTVRRIAPFFDCFNLRESQNLKGKIRLEWKEIGSDKSFTAHHLSDGTLRMICLITLLLQPKLLVLFPLAILIDEPELGLHPSALNILSALIRSASKDYKIIISTQSTSFINQFLPEDIVVVDREDNQSTFKRLNAEDLEDWLEDYTLGEIWEKNIIGGRP
jgi:predicted ATPase